MTMPIPFHHQATAISGVKKKPVLVFSPDPDLAKSLSLLLEEEFEIVCVTHLDQLLATIRATSPTVMVIDLYAFPSDVIKELRILKTSRRKIPIVVLRIKRLMSLEVEQTIHSMANTVLFKPLEGSAIADAIHRALDPRERFL